MKQTFILAEKQEQEDGVWAYGEVTVDQLMTFQVRVLTCTKENGEKTSFVTYPRRQRNGKWEDLVRPDKELREAVTKAVHQAIQNEITKDLHLPEVTVLHMTKLPVRKDQTVPILAVATVEVLGLTVSGITVKQGKDGLFVTCLSITARKKVTGMLYMAQQNGCRKRCLKKCLLPIKWQEKKRRIRNDKTAATAGREL